MSTFYAERLARALVRVAEANGLPNGISPGELSEDYTVLSPMQIGLLVTRWREDVNRLLAPHGIRITDYSDYGPGYGKRIGLDVAEKEDPA